jgi:hypothetical protein
MGEGRMRAEQGLFLAPLLGIAPAIVGVDKQPLAVLFPSTVLRHVGVGVWSKVTQTN